MVNSQLFLYLNIVIGILFVAYFLLFRGKPAQPTKLNVKAKEDFTKSILKTRQKTQQVGPQSSGQLSAAESGVDLPNTRYSDSRKMTILEPESDNNVISLKGRTKNLSIYFVYNGHEWESHEVLGVPQGSPLPTVTEAYQQLIKNSDPSTFEFYESAYQSILKRWRDRL